MFSPRPSEDIDSTGFPTEGRFPRSRVPCARAFSSAEFQKIPLIMSLSCTFKVRRTMAALWRECRLSLKMVELWLTVFLLLLLLFIIISHTQIITIHYIYNSLQVTVIVYKKRNK